jgi:hypothetical protein
MVERLDPGKFVEQWRAHPGAEGMRAGNRLLTATARLSRC